MKTNFLNEQKQGRESNKTINQKQMKENKRERKLIQIVGDLRNMM